MELGISEFKLNVQTLFYAHLHFDRGIQLGFAANVIDYEFFFPCDSVVISVDNHIDVVP